MILRVLALLLAALLPVLADCASHARDLANLIAPAKLATLGPRGANPRIQKAVALLENARRDGCPVIVPIQGKPSVPFPGFVRVAERRLRIESEPMEIEHLIIPNNRRGPVFDTHFLHQQSVKVMIQEISTRRFWGGGGAWCSEIEMAKIFDCRAVALEAVSDLKLRNVQMVLRREFNEWEFVPIETSFTVSKP